MPRRVDDDVLKEMRDIEPVGGRHPGPIPTHKPPHFVVVVVVVAISF